MAHLSNLLAQTQARPEMFSQGRDLRDVETLLAGSCPALDANGVTENYAGRPFHPRDFSGWLFESHGISGAKGFAAALADSFPDPFAAFFELVPKFRFE